MTKYFSINYRNPGHWDVWNKKHRICKIRGKPENVCVYQDYGIIKSKEGFKNIAEALTYITSHLMKAESLQSDDSHAEEMIQDQLDKYEKVRMK